MMLIKAYQLLSSGILRAVERWMIFAIRREVYAWIPLSCLDYTITMVWLLTFSCIRIPYTFDLDLDINSRMPRSEAKAIFDLIKPLGKHLD